MGVAILIYSATATRLDTLKNMTWAKFGLNVQLDIKDRAPECCNVLQSSLPDCSRLLQSALECSRWLQRALHCSRVLQRAASAYRYGWLSLRQLKTLQACTA